MSEPATNQVPKIVVIDDDYELLKLITMLLRRIGAQTQTFLDGRSAMNYLKKETPNLIILDLMLPDVDGLEIVRVLRATQRFDTVPILILSAKADPTVIRKGLDKGADSYVTKPYIANSLIDRVKLLMTQGRSASRRPNTD